MPDVDASVTVLSYIPGYTENSTTEGGNPLDSAIFQGLPSDFSFNFDVSVELPFGLDYEVIDVTTTPIFDN